MRGQIDMFAPEPRHEESRIAEMMAHGHSRESAIAALDEAVRIIRPRRVVVGFSGGVTSAWCAGWALRNFPREEIILLFHDTKEEHPDTYRFLHEMAAALGLPITERSDGRSVTQLFRDEGYLGNTRNSMCSRILKAEQGSKYVAELKAQGFEVVKVVGYSAKEPDRIARMCGHADREGFTPRFPMIEERISKQQAADWCQCEMGVRPSAQYEHFEHANCEGCVKGGRAYWLKTHEVRPHIFEQRAGLEEEFGHNIIHGENPIYLKDLLQIGLKRKVNPREAITLGACECGD